MSLKSFLSKLWNNICSLFSNFPSNLKFAVHTGVLVTENIKKFVESPLSDILTTIIPGDIDDKIKQALRAGIPVILTNLKLADNCSDSTDPQELTKCAINVISGLHDEAKNAILHNLSILISQLAADGKLSWSDGVYIVEWYYQNKFKQSA